MKKVSGFIAVLCLLVLAVPAFAQQESDSPYDIINGRHQDFAEFEKLVSGPLPWIRDKTLVPDIRAMYIAQAKRFEAFVTKYPASPLKAEALLRMAVLYFDVEGQEVHMFRQQMFFCQGVALEQQNKQDFYLCKQKFMLSVVSSGSVKDPTYEYLGRQILNELVEKYPHVKRYIRVAGGGFSFDETEEIGAIALYILTRGMMPKDMFSHYETILQYYEIRPELRRDIRNRLGGYI